MIKNVTIVPWCIWCHNCENICPLAFKVKWQSKVITDVFDDKEAAILEAAQMCPVQVIKVDHTGPTELPKPLELIHKVSLTKDIIELTFRTHSPIKRIPGQYINCIMHDEQWTFSRAYSIASAFWSTLVLTVKCTPEWRGSQYVRKCRVGERSAWSYFWPTGFFTMKSTPNRKALIATWTGLAPLYAMLCSISSKQESTLIVGARTLSDHYYLDRIALLPYVTTKVIVSAPDAGYQWLTWRVTDHLWDGHSYDEYYICGNPVMVDDVKAHLLANGVSSWVIFTESYTPLPDQSNHLHHAGSKHHGLSPRALVNRSLIWAARWMVVAYLLRKQYALLRDIARWTAVLTMSIRPLAEITGKKRLKKALILRQGLGIMSSIIVVTAWIATIVTSDPGYWANYFTATNWWLEKRRLFARLSEITWLILLITSNTFSQKILGIRRKRIHLLAWVYFYAAGVYIWSFGKTEALWSMIFVTLLLLWAWYARQFQSGNNANLDS